MVTLAGLLGLEGLLIVLVPLTGHGAGGSISNPSNIIFDLTAGSLDPAAGWIVMIVLVVLAAVVMITRDRRRLKAGLVAPPLGVTVLKVAVIAVAGVLVVIVCNTNRGVGLVTLNGVPWAVLIVLGVLVLYTVLTTRTRFGRYIYAIGGNAEAARRAGVSLDRVRTLCFTLCGADRGPGRHHAGLEPELDRHQHQRRRVRAVRGGLRGHRRHRLFGGRGKMIHALLGGLVIAVIYNGLGLIGLSAAAHLHRDRDRAAGRGDHRHPGPPPQPGRLTRLTWPVAPGIGYAPIPGVTAEYGTWHNS